MGFETQEAYVWLSSWLMVMPRALGFFIFLPFMNKGYVPGLTRIAIIISLTVIMTPAMVEHIHNIPYDLSSILLLIFKEVFIGIALGLLFSLPFWAMDSVGSIIDRQRGVMSGQLFSPAQASEATILGNALMLFSTTLLFASGGIYLLLDAFYLGYQIWPVATFFPEYTPKMGMFFLQAADGLFSLILIISGPILIAIFLVDLAFGFLNRAVPQINVFLLSLPMKGTLAILILAAYMTNIANYLKQHLFGQNESTLRALEALFMP